MTFRFRKKQKDENKNKNTLTESIKYGILINIKEEFRRKIQGGAGRIQEEQGGFRRRQDIQGSCGY